MNTQNIAVTAAWTKIASLADSSLLATWDDSVIVEVATTAADVAPSAASIGHRMDRSQQIRRTNGVGAGYVWARLASGSYVPSAVLVVTTTAGGFDYTAAPVNRSGSIAAGGTGQVLMAANASRKGLWVQNLSTGDLWINGQGAAVVGQPSLKIPTGAVYESPLGGCPATDINILGATTGQTFSAREW